MRAKLTRTARQDLEDIRRFTLARRGREQWLRYFAGLSATLERIATDPQIGRSRDSLRRELRSLTFEQHAIFFIPIRHAEGGTVIVRLIHQRRNLAALSFTDELER